MTSFFHDLSLSPSDISIMMELPGFNSADINVLNIDVRNFPSNFNSELEESVDLMQRIDGLPGEEEPVDVETVDNFVLGGKHEKE